ncbi:MAG: PilZ domain-containing protein [Pseudomonadales bacterium]|nr:PilZ domain-containing protein [Pseudomonadales bacterium]
MTSTVGAGVRSKLLSLEIRDRATLYRAYMPFLIHGGLFISTPTLYPLGTELFLLLSLPDAAEKFPAAARVVWRTPAGAQGGRKAGLGVAFTEPDCPARSYIERQLAGLKADDRPTHTL